jgi:hypothetical protein
MRLLRIKSVLVVTVFASGVLFGEEPPINDEVRPPQATAGEVQATPSVVQAMESVPMVTSKKDVDRATDIFLKGGFCVISGVLFLAGLLLVKSNSGSKVHKEA